MIARLLFTAVLLLLACPPVVADEPRERGPKSDRDKTGTDKQKDEPKADNAGQIKREGDEEVKVYEFSGLDIEGRLKTPQMLYFLKRLRAEFGRPRLPHRSFMPELQRSTKDSAF